MRALRYVHWRLLSDSLIVRANQQTNTAMTADIIARYRLWKGIAVSPKMFQTLAFIAAYGILTLVVLVGAEYGAQIGIGALWVSSVPIWKLSTMLRHKSRIHTKAEILARAGVNPYQESREQREAVAAAPPR